MPDVDDADDDMSEDVEESDLEARSLVVRIKVSPKGLLQATSRRSTPALQNGSATPPVAADDTTQAGAPKFDNSNEDQKPIIRANGSIEAVPSQASHHTWSPLGRSSYPTPTSSSFFKDEKKPLVASVADAKQAAPRFPVDAPQYGNGVSAYSTSNGVQAAVNDLQGGP